MIAAVLDSNVLVSGVVGARKEGRTPAVLMRLWRLGSFELISSEPILDEVQRALAKPYFRRRVTATQIRRLTLLLRRRTRIVQLTVEVTGVASHPADDLILATALSGNADYLVTGDAALKALGDYRDVRIVSPRNFLDILSRERGESFGREC